MPIALKRSQLKYKNPETGTYVGVDAVAEKTTAEMVAEVESAGQAKITAINARASEVQASLPKVGEMEDIVAVPFVQSETYPEGAYVVQTVNGVNHLYKLPDGHTAGVAWGEFTVIGPITFSEELNETVKELVAVQNEQPESPDNKVWLTETPPDSITVPTFDEHNELLGALNVLEDAITSPLPGINLFDGDFDSPGYIDTSGQDATSSNFKRTSKYYSLGNNPGSVLYFIATASTSTLDIMFYDANESYTHRGICDGLSSKQISLQTGDTYFRIYTDAAYTGNVCLSLTQQSDYVPYGVHGYVLKDGVVSYVKLDSELKATINAMQDISSEIEDIESNVSSISDNMDIVLEDVAGVNLFDEDYDETGYIDSSGSNAASSNYKRTSKYYPIGENSGFLYGLLSVSTPTFALRFYDDHGTYKGYKAFDAQTSGTKDIPAGSTTFRVYTDKSFSGTVCISTTQQSEYVPYKARKQFKSNIVGYENLDSELQLKMDNIDEAIAKADSAEDAINEITEEKTGVNLFDGDFDESGYIDSGVDAASSNFKRTSKYYPIPSDNSGNLYFITSNVVDTFNIQFYNASKAYTHRAIGDGYASRTITLQSGDAYFRIYTRAAYTGTACISITYQSSPVPYIEPHKGIKDDSITYSMFANDAKAATKSWLYGKTIVFMGDSIIGNFYDDTGICAKLAEETGATVINCAFGGSQIALRNTSNQQLTYWNQLSGCKLCDAIISGDFTAQETAVENLSGGLSYFQDRLETLEGIDWNNVDILMWEWGVNDFQNELTIIKDESDLTSLVSYYGAYCHTIETMLTAYPHLRIVPVTPMWRYWQDSQNDHAYLYGSDEHTIDYRAVSPAIPQLLPDFARCAIEVAEKYHLPIINNYFGMDANKWTRQQYFDVTDSVHPKAAGRARIAKRIAHALEKML